MIEADKWYTDEHSKGVVELALELADALGLDAEQRRYAEFAALLHDVGKIAVPKEIVNKHGAVTTAEWTVIKEHTIEGQQCSPRSADTLRRVGEVVRSTHERWDGGSYPDGLAGEAIQVGAGIIACADAWNAMRDRSPVSEGAAARRRGRGTRRQRHGQFDVGLSMRSFARSLVGELELCVQLGCAGRTGRGLAAAGDVELVGAGGPEQCVGRG